MVDDDRPHMSQTELSSLANFLDELNETIEALSPARLFVEICAPVIDSNGQCLGYIKYDEVNSDLGAFFVPGGQDDS